MKMMLMPGYYKLAEEKYSQYVINTASGKHGYLKFECELAGFVLYESV